MPNSELAEARKLGLYWQGEAEFLMEQLTELRVAATDYLYLPSGTIRHDNARVRLAELLEE